VWCVVCGVWCVVCGVWCVVSNAWCLQLTRLSLPDLTWTVRLCPDKYPTQRRTLDCVLTGRTLGSVGRLHAHVSMNSKCKVSPNLLFMKYEKQRFEHLVCQSLDFHPVSCDGYSWAGQVEAW